MIVAGSTLGKELGIEAVIAGERRMSFDEAIRLYHEASMHDLGRWSSAVADRVMRENGGGENLRTYVIDRNINYTNVCSANCTFCAFKRNLNDDDAYTLTTEQLHEKVRELSDIGGTQTLLQGGMHPEYGIDFYEDMLRGLKAEFPHIHVHGFSPPEFVEFVAIFDIDGFPTTAPNHGHEMDWDVWCAKLEALMRRLMDAGLDSIPGGGGEIFTEPVRKRIGLGKATAKQWLEVMATGHRLGMHTSATMMFGHIEGIADRIDHMNQVRKAQDRAINEGWPGKYVSFISWPFQRENTPLGRLPDWDNETDESFPGDVGIEHDRFAKCVRMSGASDYLRTQAISRLFLDNIHSIGSSWVTMGPRIGQLALFYGANDMGSVMMEENVVSSAGTTYCLNEAMICHLIRDSGFVPAQRNNIYNVLKVHDGDDAPDRQVDDWSHFRAQTLHKESSAEDTGDVSLPIA